MKQKLTYLTKNIQAIVIPNTILKKLDDPEEFNLELVEGKIILEPIKKEEKKNKVLGDASIDLYNIN